MRAVWSLWSKPIGADLPLMGWPTLKSHLMSWVLSLETARPFFPDTALVTDTAGARLLVDGLGLDFGSVTTDLDALDGQAPQRWAMGKLYAYRAQREPFLHIDSDVYLWEDLPPISRTAAVLAAYPEYSDFGFQAYNVATMRAHLRTTGGWTPPELLDHRPVRGRLRSENCCVIGGQRIDLLTHYADQAIRLIEDPANAQAWLWRLQTLDDMLIFEQHMLAACVDYHHKRPDSPFAGVAMSYLFESETAARLNAGARGFTHLLGGLKRDPEVVARLEARVRRDYPVFYERCLMLDRDAATSRGDG